MRLLPAALLLALLAVLLPVPAAAQDAAEAPVVVLDDPKGDVAAKAGDVPAGLPAGAWDAMDLVSLSVVESPLDFQMTLEVASLAATAQQSFFAAVAYEVVFRHHDEVYRVRTYIYDENQAFAYLEHVPAGVDPDDGFADFVADVPITLDLPGNKFTMAVPRDLLIDSQGAIPYPSRALDLFMVDAGFLNGGSATIFNVPVPVPYVEDQMPDDGVGDVPLPVRFGIEQEGDLRLASAEPFRASNGEAGTFVFRINATNLGSREQVAEFVTVGAPQAWDVRLPGLVRLEGNETAEFPVIVRTAFAHAHGSATAFTVELVGQDGVSTGRVQIGLRYPKIAQPAGHHNMVYLHNLDYSDDPLQRGVGAINWALGGYDFNRIPYFNTAEQQDDPTDAMTPVPGQTCESLRIQDDGDTVGTTYCWFAPLSPALEMGLDFDLGATGTYEIPIHSLAPQPGARVQGELVYYAPSEVPNDPFFTLFYEPTVVANLLPSDRVDIGPDGSTTFTGTIQPTEEGDYLPYQKGAHLELRLQVRTGRPDNFFLGPRTEPELMPGGMMVLPLVEYEDAVDEVFGVAGTLHLMLDGESHRLANPGDTRVFTVTLHNADADGHDFTAALVGSNREWGRIVGSDGFGVAADGTRSITVAVTVPADARDEDRADLVLEVASQDDVAVRALVRLVTTADTDAEHEDEAALLADVQDSKDAPATALPALLAALAALALAGRRRGGC